MPKTPGFNWKKTPRGWQVEVPATVSETGKRERHYFPTRDKAKEHSQKLREKFLLHGGNSAIIKPSLAEAAVAAEAILAPWGGGLVEAARFYVTAKQLEAASKPLTEATAAFLQSCEGLRDRTIEGYRQACKRLDTALADKVLATVTAEEIQAAVAPSGATGATAANR